MCNCFYWIIVSSIEQCVPFESLFTYDICAGLSVPTDYRFPYGQELDWFVPIFNLPDN